MIALFHGFILQQAWDPTVRVEPYLDTIGAVLRLLTREQQATPGIGAPSLPLARRRRRLRHG